MRNSKSSVMRKLRLVLIGLMLMTGLLMESALPVMGGTGKTISASVTSKKKKKKKNSNNNQNQNNNKQTQNNSNQNKQEPETAEQPETEITVEKDGEYTTKEEVAAYIHEYGKLPKNFITKKEAKNLGWESSKGNLGKVAPGKSIGGDHFGNYEGTLPEKKGRSYTECDIDADGGYRGSKRIIFSNDGLIYYTQDHYETFELLYGEE